MCGKAFMSLGAHAHCIAPRLAMMAGQVTPFLEYKVFFLLLALVDRRDAFVLCWEPVSTQVIKFVDGQL